LTDSSRNTSVPVRSMTGYALVRKETSAGELTCSLRSVNGRGLDLHFYFPAEFAIFENSMRVLLKEKIGRGHIEVRLSLASQPAPERAAYNKAVIERFLLAFRDANAEFGLQSVPDLNVLFGLPGVLDPVKQAVTLDEGFASELLGATESCASQLNTYREREGAALVEAITTELRSLEESVASMASIRTGIVPYLSTRIQERLRAFLDELHLPETRLVEEATLLADKSDVQEEITRLEVHSKELRRLLDTGGEVGKRLDFLLQEMNRETNTILSKSSTVGDLGIQITSLGLAVKANIERMREQSLNLE
jgi:uncharacterized protein (TIGR00255 family)